ncbi:MAG: hypothetical protein ACI9XC_001505 [Gammaproteobacteria bacterium]|jgi:hypothetical protein
MPTEASGSTFEFDAIYNVFRGGLNVAKMHRTLSNTEDGQILYSETNTTGIVSLFRKDKIIEKSIWKNINGKLEPEFYEYDRSGTKKPRNVTVKFDWVKNQITNSINGSSWKMPAEEGVIDKLLYQYFIMLDLQQGKSNLQYQIADGGKEKTYIFEIIGEEIIDTPMGKLRTIKLIRRRKDSDRTSIFWSAPDMNFLPVKLEITDEGEKTTVVINSLKGHKN